MAKGEIKENKIKDNEIQLPDGTKKILLSTKLKYLKDGSYNGYQVIKKIGVINLLTKFADGEELLLKTLGAIFDQKPEEITWLDDADADLINEIISKSLKVNEIKEEDDFLASLATEEAVKV